MSKKYLVPAKQFSQQYSHLYSKRVQECRKLLEVVARTKYGNEVAILSKIIECETMKPGEECVLIGTVYKEMQLKPSVLDEFRDQYGVASSGTSGANYCRDDDSLLLEDESGRIRLDCSKADSARVRTSTDRFVTGVTLGVKGSLLETGVFAVQELVQVGDTVLQTALSGKGAAEAVPLPVNGGAGRKYVLLASGLQVGAAGTDVTTAASHLFSLQLLVDFVTGRLGGGAVAEGEKGSGCVADKIVKVILAGNSLADAPARTDGAQPKDKENREKDRNSAAAALGQLDALLTQLLVNVPVDVIPGETDPCSTNFPQQPMHPCLLPHASRFKNFLQLSTNPYECSISQSPAGNDVAKVSPLRILGHSGRPLYDMATQTRQQQSLRATVEEAAATAEGAGGDGGEATQSKPMELTPETDSEPVNTRASSTNDAAATAREQQLHDAQVFADMLEDTLRWGNLCPTAPDSLPCYPFTDRDPFVLQDLASNPPAVVFAGNAPGFVTRLFEAKDSAHRTRFVCVPAFHATRQAVLLDVESLDCHVLSFQ